MKYKAIIMADVELEVWIEENANGDKELIEVIDITQVNDYEVKTRLN